MERRTRNNPRWKPGEPISLTELERVQRLAGRVERVEAEGMDTSDGGIASQHQNVPAWWVTFQALITNQAGTSNLYSFSEVQQNGAGVFLVMAHGRVVTDDVSRNVAAMEAREVERTETAPKNRAEEGGVYCDFWHAVLEAEFAAKTKAVKGIFAAGRTYREFSSALKRAQD